MFTPIIVQLEWDGWTDRLVMPRDYLRLSTEERRLISIEELRSWAPREMHMVPDWGMARLFAATMLPGFRANVFAFGAGTGVQKYSRIFITDTTLTEWQVPTDWANGDNMVELLGGSGTTGKANYGYGGHGGGGGAYAMRRNIQFDKNPADGKFPKTPIKIGKVGNADPGDSAGTSKSDTNFKDPAYFRANGGNSSSQGSGDGSLGDVVHSGGFGNAAGSGGDYRRVIKKDSHGHSITTDYWGGGGGGGGGGGAGGPDGPGLAGNAGSNGADATANGPGGPGGGGSGGDGGPPDGGKGFGQGSSNGGAGTFWDTTHGSGAGGTGGNGGKGGMHTYEYPNHNPSTLRDVAAGNGSRGGNAGKYGAGAGGGGGGGNQLSGVNNDGDSGNGGTGLIVITNNSTSVIT